MITNYYLFVQVGTTSRTAYKTFGLSKNLNWGYVKSLGRGSKPETTEYLKGDINIPPTLFDKLVKKWTYQLNTFKEARGKDCSQVL